MSLSTHVLDATSGWPAEGVGVLLESLVDDDWEPRGAGRTDGDGRIRELGMPGVGVHRITFDSGGYFTSRAVPTFYPQVTITFEITDADVHHHVPLLLSPFAYSTYRGS